MNAQAMKAMVNDARAMRGLIGRRVRYLGEAWEISDLLIEEGLMILCAEDGAEVQDDSYGRPHRLVPRRETVAFRDADGCPTGIWDDLAFLDGPLARD